MLDSIRLIIRREVLSVGYRLLAGLVVTAAVIFALYHIENEILAFLTDNYSSSASILVVFGSIAVIGLLTLFQVLRPYQIWRFRPLRSRGVVVTVEPTDEFQSLDIEALRSLAIRSAQEFIIGAVEGYSTSVQNAAKHPGKVPGTN